MTETRIATNRFRRRTILLASGLVLTAAIAFGMVMTIGGVALIAAFARGRLVGLLSRSEGWRERADATLEVGGALLVFLLGAATLVKSLAPSRRRRCHEMGYARTSGN